MVGWGGSCSVRVEEGGRGMGAGALDGGGAELLSVCRLWISVVVDEVAALHAVWARMSMHGHHSCDPSDVRHMISSTTLRISTGLVTHQSCRAYEER